MWVDTGLPACAYGLVTWDNKIFFGEFVGTAILLLMGNGVVAAVLLPKSKAFGAGWVVIAFGWGFGVLAGAYSALNLSGGHLNPAVTVGIATYTGEWGEVGVRIVAQVLGAFAGAVLCWLAYYGHFRVAGQPTLGIFATVPAIRNTVQNLMTEIIGTFVLVFFILTTVVQDTGPVAKIASSGVGVLLVAFLVVGIGLSLGGPTGYAINPARDLGPRIAHAFLPIPGKGDSDWGYFWIPVVGPIVGAVAAAGAAATLL
jgi:glycerol uptake facilitator protein